MVISHKHKYLFVELPKTATSAISHELIETYAGEKILRKRSAYRDFRYIVLSMTSEHTHHVSSDEAHINNMERHGTRASPSICAPGHICRLGGLRC
jgi:hypothetical protein